MPSKYDSLLIGWNSFLVLNAFLDLLDILIRGEIDGDRLPSKSFDEQLAAGRGLLILFCNSDHLILESCTLQVSAVQYLLKNLSVLIIRRLILAQLILLDPKSHDLIRRQCFSGDLLGIVTMFEADFNQQAELEEVQLLDHVRVFEHIQELPPVLGAYPGQQIPVDETLLKLARDQRQSKLVEEFFVALEQV